MKLTLTIAALLLALLPAVLAAQPSDLPAKFAGNAYLDGRLAPEGTLVEAVWQGAVLRSATVEYISPVYNYIMNVAKPETGGTVHFRVGGQPAGQQAEWEVGTTTAPFDLHALTTVSPTLAPVAAAPAPTIPPLVIAGPVGPQGPQGPEGPRGATGYAGPEGPPGPTGVPGQDGAPGSRGPKGDAGERGLEGETGPQGLVGPQGPPGEAGATGEQGLAGPAGPEGAQGPEGPAGPAGTGNSGILLLVTFFIAVGALLLAGWKTFFDGGPGDSEQAAEAQGEEEPKEEEPSEDAEGDEENTEDEGE